MNELVTPETFNKILENVLKKKYNEQLINRNSFKSLKQIHSFLPIRDYTMDEEEEDLDDMHNVENNRESKSKNNNKDEIPHSSLIEEDKKFPKKINNQKKHMWQGVITANLK